METLIKAEGSEHPDELLNFWQQVHSAESTGPARKNSRCKRGAFVMQKIISDCLRVQLFIYYFVLPSRAGAAV